MSQQTEVEPTRETATATPASNRWLWGTALVLWTAIVTLCGAAITDSLTGATISGLPDPGPLTRFSLPIVQSIRDVVALVTLGALLVAATCLPGSKGDRLRGPRARLLVLSQVTALTWAICSAALIALTYSDASGVPLSDPAFADGVMLFARNFDVGTYLVWGTGLATLITLGATVVQRVGGLGWLLAFTVAGLWTIALTGHAAGTADHENAVNYQFIHLLGIGVWAGSLAALAWVRRTLEPADLSIAVRRFSTLAGWSLAAVAVSGVLAAVLRIPAFSDLWTGYGSLVLLKSVALLALLVAGWWQRRHLLDRLADGAPRAFARLVAGELVVLFTAAGLGVALNRSAPPPAPRTAESLSFAESKLGQPFPPELTGSRWATEWNLDSLFAPLTVLVVVAYVVAVVKLHRRGDSWPWARTLSWVIGWAIFFWATSGAPAVYGRVLFSAHMVQHMTIAMAVPVFLVLGAPITLALRALPARRDHSRGIREWLLAIVHSRPAAVLTQPIVAAVIFVVGMMGFYYSPLFEMSMRAHTGHILMTLHFLLSGYVLVSCLIGTDPGIKRPSYPLRLLLMMVTFAFHAFFAISLMASEEILAKDWFTLFDRDWGDSLADDQYLGASLGWAFGELPLAIIALALLAGWVSSDRRERRRFDRNEARTGDQELASYNAFLQRIAEGTEGRGRARESVVAEEPDGDGEQR
ncbi:cytochrome c oxidase assembly protein [Nocardioides sp. Bht2]|uniref:cytochrome c oxidase assembly protein n=1 Tax=Nocardioides sp. Bht2 TaxID=3392297 RepID=UPI0039B544A5